MKFLNEWTYTVCITLIVSIIFSLLLPKNSSGKFAKALITVFIMISFFIPFKSGAVTLQSDFFDELNFEINEETLTQKESSYKNIIENNIKTALENGGYEGCAVDAKLKLNDNIIDKSDDNYDEISLKSVDVSVPDKFNKVEVKDYLLEETGINAEVYYIGE